MGQNSSNIHVCHVIYSLNLGGAERMVVDLSEELDQRPNVSSTIVVLGSRTERSVKTNCKSVAYFCLNKFDVFSCLKCILGQIERADILHAHLFPAQYYVPLAVLLTKKKPTAVLTLHEVENVRRRLPLRFLDNLLLTQYRKIFCVSDEVREQYISSISDGLVRSVVVENGIGNRFFQRFQEEPSVLRKTRQEDIEIVYIGRLVKEKNLETLIDVIVFLPARFKLTLVGDGDWNHQLVTRARNNGVADRVCFKGQCEDVAPYLCSASLMVHTSTSEGFGLSILEALAVGLPVIAPRLDSFEELFSDSINYYAISCTPFDISEYVINLLKKPKIIRSRVLRGHKIASKYSLVSCADKYLESYRSTKL